MKRNVLFLLLAMTVTAGAWAQNTDDDMYFTPSKKSYKTTSSATSTSSTTAATTDGLSQFDEYKNRGTYIGSDQAYNDTLRFDDVNTINDDSCWVNGFRGSADDYEHARELIRFRNPRYAIPYGTQLYFDILAWADPWEWNIYDDGYYLYCFPTFSNRWWWNWRYSDWGLWRSLYYYSYWGWHNHGFYDDPWHGGFHHIPWHHHSISGFGGVRAHGRIGGRPMNGGRFSNPGVSPRGSFGGAGARGNRGGMSTRSGSYNSRGGSDRGATRGSFGGMTRSSSSYSRSSNSRMGSDGYSRSSSTRSNSGYTGSRSSYGSSRSSGGSSFGGGGFSGGGGGSSHGGGSSSGGGGSRGGGGGGRR